ncbi:hypothetical protein ACTTZI_004171 [Vibrio vulnificus]
MNRKLSSATVLLMSLGVLGGCAADHQEYQDFESESVMVETNQADLVHEDKDSADYTTIESGSKYLALTNKAKDEKEIEISDSPFYELSHPKTKAKETNSFGSLVYPSLNKDNTIINNSSKLRPLTNVDLSLEAKVGERYFDALNRWAREKGYKAVAWELPHETKVLLSKKFDGDNRKYSHSINVATVQISNEINKPLYFHMNETSKLAAFTSWKSPAQITMVQGKSFHHAVKGVVLSYGWNWIENVEHGNSYQAMNNYPFTSAYPIATKRGDISSALGKVISQYPVNASLLDSTKTVFIVDTK